MINANNPTLKSWVEVPDNSDFPIQNLPYGVFKTDYLDPVAGVAIGEYIIDMVYMNEHGYLDGLGLPIGIFNQKYLNDFISLGKPVTNSVRERLSELLRHDNPQLRDNKKDRELAMIHMEDAEMLVPVRIGDYTDFYSSEQHAVNVGTMFRDPENALLPNWKHLPVAYHGRASSIIPTKVPIRRPKGQTKAPDEVAPSFGPTKRLDFELEMAFISAGKTPMGESISTANAEDHIFGFVVFNDWSARDVQAWEYVPLGPFLAKNFASSISPWIVTIEALDPFRVPGPSQDPKVLPYLEYQGNRHFDVNLEVDIKPEGAEPTTVCRSNFQHMYWNPCQQLAHHTVNGCNINVGDMFASGTISGTTPDSFGSMLELSWKGTKTVAMADGSERKFINDHDSVIMRGFGEKNGVRIGFGEVETKVLPSF